MLLILLTLIFVRPFISSLAFVYLNLFYSIVLLGFLIVWFIYKIGLRYRSGAIFSLPNRQTDIATSSFWRLTWLSPFTYLLLFLLALFISIIFSTDKANSLRELYKYINGILIFLVAISLNYKQRLGVIKIIVLAGFVISLLAIYQYFFGFAHILGYLAKHKISSSFTLDYIQRRRVFFPFVSPNTLGAFMIIIIPLILGLWNKKKKILLNPLFFFLILVSFTLLLTKSLGALLSIFLGLIIYFCLHTPLEKNHLAKSKTWDKKKLLLITGLLITIGIVFLIRQAAIKQHFLPSFSLRMRLNYWKDTLKIIKASPLTGIGLGNFNLTHSRFSHNSYLQIWAEMGILGIISILGLISTVFKSAGKNIKTSSDKKLIASLITANAVFLIHNFVDFSFFLPEISLIWWVLSGLLLAV